MKKEEIYKAALEEYGLHKQIVVAIEELSELQKELCKYLRGRENYEGLAEELADVEIVVEQMKLFLRLEGTTLDWKVKKLSRLEGRVTGGGAK